MAVSARSTGAGGHSDFPNPRAFWAGPPGRSARPGGAGRPSAPPGPGRTGRRGVWPGRYGRARPGRSLTPPSGTTWRCGPGPGAPGRPADVPVLLAVPPPALGGKGECQHPLRPEPGPAPRPLQLPHRQGAPETQRPALRGQGAQQQLTPLLPVEPHLIEPQSVRRPLRPQGDPGAVLLQCEDTPAPHVHPLFQGNSPLSRHSMRERGEKSQRSLSRRRTST